jgi:S-adenosylmethionine synthetase
MGVNSAFDDAGDEGAGDQGMMFASPAMKTSNICLRRYPWPTLCPGGWRRCGKRRARFSGSRRQTQVTIEYDGSGRDCQLSACWSSLLSMTTVSINEIREGIVETVIKP